MHRDFSVLLTDGFPYLPPKVTTNAIDTRTWHQELDGGICLYTSRDRDQLPWLDPDAFLDRVALWFEKNKEGWPDDPPALDVEAYLGLPLDPRFIIHGDLNPYVGGYVTLRSDGQKLLRVSGPGKAAKKRSRELSGYVADIGQLTQPPRDWDSFLDRFDGADAIREEIRRGRLDVLLMRYHRSAQQGVLAVTFPTSAREPWFAHSAGFDQSSMGLRSGPAKDELGSKHVYVIGAGALGSHVCDGLSRAGIGHLTIRDFDHLTPGNMTRHLVTDLEMCGTNKASALSNVLRGRPYNRAEIVDVQNGLATPLEALELLEGDKLVVDATGDGSVTAMLEDAARISGLRFFTACLQNDGRTQRVDLVPPLEPAQPLPMTQAHPSSGPEIFEGGCGEPVSPTPPFAVAEAAAMTVRHIVGYLTGKTLSPAGEVREFE